ncbi:hypothetical protein AB0B18_24260 [Micromonospora chalcea]
MQASGAQWLSLSDAERREVALQVLARVPVLWIWDNVEAVAGFPAGTPSAWTADEQRELRDFLQAGSRTRARVLMTSRRDKRGWLGDLPARVRLPRMPMRERIQFTQALAARGRPRRPPCPASDWSSAQPGWSRAAWGSAVRWSLPPWTPGRRYSR